MGLIRTSRMAGRAAPWEFQDAVEEFARQGGTHARLFWAPAPVNCWIVRFDLKPGDPRLLNENPEDQFEDVLLHYWLDPDTEPRHPKIGMLPKHPKTGKRRAGYIAYELDELGVSGLVGLLEKQSLTSGRGEYESAEEAVKAQKEAHKTKQERLRKAQVDDAKHAAKQVARQVTNTPFNQVGIDLTTPSPGESP